MDLSTPYRQKDEKSFETPSSTDTALVDLCLRGAPPYSSPRSRAVDFVRWTCYSNALHLLTTAPRKIPFLLLQAGQRRSVWLTYHQQLACNKRKGRSEDRPHHFFAKPKWSRGP